MKALSNITLQYRTEPWNGSARDGRNGWDGPGWYVSASNTDTDVQEEIVPGRRVTSWQASRIAEDFGKIIGFRSLPDAVRERNAQGRAEEEACEIARVETLLTQSQARALSLTKAAETDAADAVDKTVE